MTDTDVPAQHSTSTAVWVTVGIIAGLGPAWLFAIAAFSGLGPASASASFALPVLAATAIAMWIAVRLARAGARTAALTVGIVALVAGVLADIAWVYLAALGVQFGNGPL